MSSNQNKRILFKYFMDNNKLNYELIRIMYLLISNEYFLNSIKIEEPPLNEKHWIEIYYDNKNECYNYYYSRNNLTKEQCFHDIRMCILNCKNDIYIYFQNNHYHQYFKELFIKDHELTQYLNNISFHVMKELSQNNGNFNKSIEEGDNNEI